MWIYELDGIAMTCLPLQRTVGSVGKENSPPSVSEQARPVAKAPTTRPVSRVIYYCYGYAFFMFTRNYLIFFYEPLLRLLHEIRLSSQLNEQFTFREPQRRPLANHWLPQKACRKSRDPQRTNL
jgi:hypothetical protein